MKNYEVIKTEVPGIFTLFDNETGKRTADVSGESEAKTFSLVPQMVAILNEIVDNGGMSNEETLKLFLERNNLLT